MLRNKCNSFFSALFSFIKIFITSVRANHWSITIEDNKKDSNKMK